MLTTNQNLMQVIVDGALALGRLHLDSDLPAFFGPLLT